MVTRLNDLLIAGAIFNTSPFSVHGQLQLRGAEMPLHFELTGRPCEELCGKHFEFELFENEGSPSDDDRERAGRLASQQIGPCRLTVSGGGEIPGLICLEWFGQNGRVAVEIPSAQVRPIKIDKSDPAEESDDDFDGEPADDDDDIPDFPPALEETSDDEEGYGLIPDDLNRELERSARRTDLEISGESAEDIDAMEELERMDDLIENGEGTPIRDLLSKLRLPEPDDITTDAGAGEALTRALAEMALYGTAFHICQHCTPRSAYRLLMENADEFKIFPEMRGSAWVQHFSTSDCCPDCLGDPPF